MFKITSITTEKVSVLPTARGFKLPGSDKHWIFKAGAKEKMALAIAAIVVAAIVVANPWDNTIHTTIINGVTYAMDR